MCIGGVVGFWFSLFFIHYGSEFHAPHSFLAVLSKKVKSYSSLQCVYVQYGNSDEMKFNITRWVLGTIFHSNSKKGIHDDVCVLIEGREVFKNWCQNLIFRQKSPCLVWKKIGVHSNFFGTILLQILDELVNVTYRLITYFSNLTWFCKI